MDQIEKPARNERAFVVSKLEEVLCGRIEDWFLITGLRFQLHAGTFEKGLDHFTDALLHFGADCRFADQDCETVQILCMLPSEFYVLHDLDQNFLTALFKSCRKPSWSDRRDVRFGQSGSSVHGIFLPARLLEFNAEGIFGL